MASVTENIDGIGMPPSAPEMATGRIGGAQPQPVAQPQPQNDGRTKAPDFMTIARQATVATAMSSEGSNYVKTLKEYLRDKNTMSQTIEVRTLPYPSETTAITMGDQCILLLFSEALRRNENLPTIADAKQAFETMQATLGNNLKMRNCIVVTPDDYPRAEIMGASLLNTFSSLLSPDVQSLNINSLNDCYLEVSLNPSVYDDFVNRYDPHGVPPMASLGITVSLAKNQRNRNHQEFFNSASDEKMEIGAIGAYVTFIKTTVMGGMTKFIPEVHISNLVSPLPFDGMLTLLLSVATDVLMDNGYWKTQFNEFGGPNSPNIGNLVTDRETNAPFRVENSAQRDYIFGSYCENPILVLDVVNGRYCIPGLESYALKDNHPFVIAGINRFLNADGAMQMPTTVSPGNIMAREYIGTIGRAGGSHADSRWVNYLNMMIHHSSDPLVQKLLDHPGQPEDGVNLVRNFQKDLCLLYVNDMVLLEASVLRKIQQMVHDKIRVINGNNNVGTIDTSAMLQAGQAFAQSMTQNYYSYGSTPFNQLYGVNGLQGQTLYRI